MKTMVRTGKDAGKLSVLIAGMTFKENVPDIRNSKVFDIYKAFQSFGLNPFVCDPIASEKEVMHEYSIQLKSLDSMPKVDLIVLAVAHNKFKTLSLSDWKRYLNEDGFVADIKGMYNKQEADKCGVGYWGM